jgi:hypothetical protein
MFLDVSFRRLLAVMHGVSCMSSRCVSLVRAFLMVSGVVVLGRFTVMMGGVRMMFRSLLVMFGSFLGHCHFLQDPKLPDYPSLITAATVKAS